MQINNKCACGNQAQAMNHMMPSNANEAYMCNTEFKAENAVDNQLQAKMIEEIRACEFAITELGLYLDTHPEDEKALCLHRKYCKQLKDIKDKYQKVYGPLTMDYPCNKWRWLEEPWPWERGSF